MNDDLTRLRQVPAGDLPAWSHGRFSLTTRPDVSTDNGAFFADRQPWGPEQTAREITPGILSVSTARHGGLLVSAGRWLDMPRTLRDLEPFAGLLAYEEDEDAAIVALAFPQHFPLRAAHHARTTAAHAWWGKSLDWSAPSLAPVVARSERYLDESRGLYERGAMATSGNSWIIYARPVALPTDSDPRTGVVRLVFRDNRWMNLPEPFALDAAVQCGGEVLA